jgi:hypothetical protein
MAYGDEDSVVWGPRTIKRPVQEHTWNIEYETGRIS